MSLCFIYSKKEVGHQNYKMCLKKVIFIDSSIYFKYNFKLTKTKEPVISLYFHNFYLRRETLVTSFLSFKSNKELHA